MLFLTNPKKGRTIHRKNPRRVKSRRKPPKGFSTWTAYMASIRPKRRGGTMARRARTRHRRNAPKRHRVRHRRNPVHARARKRTTYRANSHHRRRRGYRRNPSRNGNMFSRGKGLIGGMMSLVKNGAIGSIGVMAGRVAPRLATDVTGIDTAITNSSLTGMPATAALAAAQLAVGLLAAMITEKVVSPKAAVFVMAGTFDGVIEDVLNGATGSQFPLIGAYLGNGASTLDATARSMGFGAYGPPNARIASYSRAPKLAGYSGGRKVNVRRIGISGGNIAR